MTWGYLYAKFILENRLLKNEKEKKENWCFAKCLFVFVGSWVAAEEWDCPSEEGNAESKWPAQR